jgi:putative endopeptidase
MPRTRRRTRKKSQIPAKPDLPPAQEHIKPGNDFYKFINGNWLRHVNMPPYMSSYGVSEEIEDIINEELMEILLESRQTVRTMADKKIPHTTYLLGTLVESALNTPSQDLNVKFIKNLVTSLRCIRDVNDLGATLGEFIKYRIKSPLMCVVVPQEKKSDTLRLALSYGDLGLPDISYYEEKTTRVLAAYTKLLNKLSVEFDIPGLEQVIAIERGMADAIYQSQGDVEVLMSGRELAEKYKHIPWNTLAQSAFGWTPSEFHSHKLLIFSKRWIGYLNKWMHVLPISQWKLLLSGNLLLHFLPLLPPPYDDMEFELFGHRLRGQSEKLPQKRLALRLAQQWLSASLGSEFIKRSVSPSIKENAMSIAKEIKAVAAKRIGDVDWLEKVTKEKAALKIKNIYLGVAYPSEINKDKHTLLNPERLVENVIKLSYLDFKDEFAKVNTTLDRVQWDDPVFAVNAFYYNEGNRLILPAGILRWPFFHPSASDGWNFGGIGATIGHEICHAFDNDGKEYDEFGNKNPWWSKKEQMAYREKAKQIIELYNRSLYFGQHLSGLLTLSENIADLGGVAIALAALKHRLELRGVSPEVKRKEICDFFTSFAVSWRTKEKKEKALQSLFMDVHAPPSVRVNNIVSQFDDWYECFDIKPGNELYKSPENRIRIF